MASLFRSFYDLPGLAPRIDVLFWGRRDFQISFSNRDMSRNAWNRLEKVLWSKRGSYQTIWSFPLTNVILWTDYIQLQPLLIRLCTELDRLPIFKRFPYNISDGCGMQTGDAYSSGHLVPSLWDLHIFYFLRPIVFPNLSLFFRTMLSKISIWKVTKIQFNFALWFIDWMSNQTHHR